MRNKKLNLFIFSALVVLSIASCKKEEIKEPDVIVNINDDSNFDLITKNSWKLESIVDNNGGVLTDGLEDYAECNLDEEYVFADDYIYSIIAGPILCPEDSIIIDTTTVDTTIVDTLVIIIDTTDVFNPPMYWNFANDEESLVINDVAYDLIGLSNSTLRYRLVGDSAFHRTFTFSSN